MTWNLTENRRESKIKQEVKSYRKSKVNHHSKITQSIWNAYPKHQIFLWTVTNKLYKCPPSEINHLINNSKILYTLISLQKGVHKILTAIQIYSKSNKSTISLFPRNIIFLFNAEILPNGYFRICKTTQKPIHKCIILLFPR